MTEVHGNTSRLTLKDLGPSDPLERCDHLYMIMILSTVLQSVALITYIAIFVLVIRHRIFRMITLKLLAVYVGVNIVCGALILPLGAVYKFSQYMDESGCLVYAFVSAFLSSVKGPLVLSIAIFSYIECQQLTISKCRYVLNLFITLLFVFVLAVIISGFTIYDLTDDKQRGFVRCWGVDERGNRIPTKYDNRSTQADLLLNVLPPLVGIILVMCRCCKFPSQASREVGWSTVMVATYSVIWCPSVITLTLKGWDILDCEKTGMLLYLSAEIQLALTPVLLLALPTIFRKALSESIRMLYRRRSENQDGAPHKPHGVQMRTVETNTVETRENTRLFENDRTESLYATNTCTDIDQEIEPLYISDSQIPHKNINTTLNGFPNSNKSGTITDSLPENETPKPHNEQPYLEIGSQNISPYLLPYDNDGLDEIESLDVQNSNHHQFHRRKHSLNLKVTPCLDIAPDPDEKKCDTKRRETMDVDSKENESKKKKRGLPKRRASECPRRRAAKWKDAEYTKEKAAGKIPAIECLTEKEGGEFVDDLKLLDLVGL